MPRLTLLIVLLATAVAVAEPQRLAFRYLHVGRALGRYDVTTYRLDLDSSRAELTVERAVTEKPQPLDELGPYLPMKPASYRGTATATKNGVSLAFEGRTTSPSST